MSKNALAIFLVAIFVLCGCRLAKLSYQPCQPNCLRINIGAEPPSLDWHVSTDATSFDVVSNLMVGLTQYDNKLHCKPACAYSWEVLDGGKRYVFHLRKDIRWSDGKQLVAYDFEYAWKRLLYPETAAQYAYFLYPIENAFEFNTGKIKDSTKVGIKARDPQTLEIRLKKPTAYFIYLTAFCPTYPQRQDVVEKWGNSWTEPGHIVTNGPFLLDRWLHEYKIVLTANPLFFEGKPRLNQIKMFMIPEQSTAYGLYENNELDLIDNRSFATCDVFACRNSSEYHNFPLLRNNYLGFNVRKKPFSDRLVRLAIAMSVDRNIFPRILRRGEYPSFTWIPPGLAGFHASSGPKFNIAEARRMLAAAGYKDGHNFPKVQLLYPNREDTRLVVESIQDQLKRNLNIHVELVNQEWKVYLETLRRNAPPIFRGSWGADYPDPETFMNLFTSHNGNNNTSWSNTQYDQLVSQASSEQDSGKRAALYSQADQLLCSKEAPIVCTYLSTQNLMVKPWVQGIEFNPLDLQFFKNVSVNKNVAKRCQ